METCGEAGAEEALGEGEVQQEVELPGLARQWRFKAGVGGAREVAGGPRGHGDCESSWRRACGVGEDTRRTRRKREGSRCGVTEARRGAEQRRSPECCRRRRRGGAEEARRSARSMAAGASMASSEPAGTSTRWNRGGVGVLPIHPIRIEAGRCEVTKRRPSWEGTCNGAWGSAGASRPWRRLLIATDLDTERDYTTVLPTTVFFKLWCCSCALCRMKRA